MQNPSKKQQFEEENQDKGTSYYLNQLNQLYVEQSSKVRRLDEMDEKEKLTFMAELLRILPAEDEIQLMAYVERALVDLKTNEENVREAISYLSSAGLVEIKKDSIRLTESGRELLSVK